MHWLKQLRILAALCLLMSERAGAIGAFSPSAGELGLLPAYCGPRAQRWGNDLDHPHVRRWYSVFGDDYLHMHHYCQGMLLLMRGDRQPLHSPQATGEYQAALNNLEYMESHVSSGFVLMPELYLKKGRVLQRLDRDREAVRAFRRAIKLKHDYVLAYAALSDFYQVRGKSESARQVLQEGLAAVPDASILQRRLAEIGREQGQASAGEQTEAEAAPVPETEAADTPGTDAVP